MKKIEFKKIEGISRDVIALIVGVVIGALIKTFLF